MAVQVEGQTLTNDEFLFVGSCGEIFIQLDGCVLCGRVDLLLKVRPGRRPHLRLSVVVRVHGDAANVREEELRGVLTIVVRLEARGERYVGLVIALLVRQGNPHVGAILQRAVYVELPAAPNVDIVALPSRRVVLHDGRTHYVHVFRVGGYVDAASVPLSVVLGKSAAIDVHQRVGFAVNRAALFERSVLGEGAVLDR